MLELNKRLLTINAFNIDLNDLNECTTYDAELKLNNIENLEAALSDTRHSLATSSEQDGYWCFRRKEGCKYLAAQTPTPAHTQTKATQAAATTNALARARLRQLHFYYYGYAWSKQGRNLGLVRRRVGRGGRIVLERFNRNVLGLLGGSGGAGDNSNDDDLYSFNYFSKFKTYYPKECMEPSEHERDNESLVPDSKRAKLRLKGWRQQQQEDQTWVHTINRITFLTKLWWQKL